MILDSYIVTGIDAARLTGLNGEVTEDYDIRIVVVSFDGRVTEPCAYRIGAGFRDLGRKLVEYVNGRLPEGGNLLEIRGPAVASNRRRDGRSGGMTSAAPVVILRAAGRSFGVVRALCRPSAPARSWSSSGTTARASRCW